MYETDEIFIEDRNEFCINIISYLMYEFFSIYILNFIVIADDTQEIVSLV